MAKKVGGETIAFLFIVYLILLKPLELRFKSLGFPLNPSMGPFESLLKFSVVSVIVVL